VAEAERRKGGGKLSRSETVTVRLDPKLRYMAELGARRQRRTLSSYIEWAIEDSLKHVNADTSGNSSLADEVEVLWDVDEADRLARLALRHPELLTHEEQVLWKLIKENGWLWRGQYAGAEQEWRWVVREESLIFERLRDKWPAFVSVAERGGGHDQLPTWRKTRPIDTAPVVKPKTGFEDMDDDIPF
jgi:hypothetical protein